MFAAGYAGTDGIFHTGIGPFDATGIGVGYAPCSLLARRVKFDAPLKTLNFNPPRE